MNRRAPTEREVAQILANSSADLGDWRQCQGVLWEKGIKVADLPPGAWLSSRNLAVDLREQAARVPAPDLIELRLGTIADRNHRHTIPILAALIATIAGLLTIVVVPR
jgi:hypothetical protein